MPSARAAASWCSARSRRKTCFDCSRQATSDEAHDVVSRILHGRESGGPGVDGGVTGVNGSAAVEPSLQGFLRDWEARHPEDVVHVREEVDPDCLSTSMALELE